MRLLRPGDPIRLDDDLVIEGENSDVLQQLPAAFFDLVYVDPPFNTGRPRRGQRVAAIADRSAGRRGFGGRHYRLREDGEQAAFADERDDYLAFLIPRLARARELLAPHGTLYVHLDYREAHYVKVELDRIFGRDCFLNEIVWAYDYGGKPRRRWPAKHDTILVYVRDPKRYWFDSEVVDREPYMAPGLVTPEQVARGKRPTDCWWYTIVPTNSAERTGYPTQKPEGVVRRMVQASSRPEGWCLDFFAGSGTLGAVCAGLGRRYVLVDENPEAISVMRRRLGSH